MSKHRFFHTRRKKKHRQSVSQMPPANPSVIQDNTSSLISTDGLRSLISRLNAYRTWWNCSRRLSGFATGYLEDAGVLDVLKPFNVAFGHHYHPGDLNALLDHSRDSLRALSVGLYGARFMLNAVALFQQVVNAYGDPRLSARAVAGQELEKYGVSMFNDLVWGTVNLLTNYSEACGLPAQYIGPLIMSAYLFDVLLFVARWMTDAHRTGEKTALTPLLQDEWQAKCAYYQFNIVAATVLIVSYGSTFFIQAPVACASMNMLANGLYNSAGDYQRARHSALTLRREQSPSVIASDQRSNDGREANQRFWLHLLSNTCSAALVLTAAGLSWPIALCLTLSLFSWQSQEAGASKAGYNRNRLFSGADERSLRSSISSQEDATLEQAQHPGLICRKP